MKVGECVSKFDIIKKVIIKNGGLAKTADFVASGLSTYDVANLCKKGLIERIRHGFYQLPKTSDITEEKLLATLLPEGIICVESALYHYGYSDFTPRLWTIAVPRTISRTKLKIDAVPLKAYYIQKQYLDLGKVTADFDGVDLSIYDRERTICDCFKYRTKLDSELFNKAIYAYAADDKKNLANLSKYAKEMKIYRRVIELMEVILNG
jgi:predicted transcriptional regulator of viral defense system